MNLGVISRYVNIGIESLESFGLALCILLAAPLGFFRGLDSFFRSFEYAPVLLRERLFATLLRSRLDARMHNFQQAVVLLGPVVIHFEKVIAGDGGSSNRNRRLLCRLYCEMLRFHLLCGQVEDAVLVVIRAQKHLGIDRLPSHPTFDLKTAHVVKAGLAASKLLEEGGLATLLVRPGEDPVVGTSPLNQGKQKSSPPRRSSDRVRLVRPFKQGDATIIPFPGQQ